MHAKDKMFDILIKSMVYFSVKRIKVIGNSDYLAKVIEKHQDIKQGPPTDLIYFEHPPKDMVQMFTEDEMHNNSVILVNHIRSQPIAYTHWLELVRHEAVTVSMDFFSCGALFLRKEQEKQHFTIRI